MVERQGQWIAVTLAALVLCGPTAGIVSAQGSSPAAPISATTQAGLENKPLAQSERSAGRGLEDRPLKSGGGGGAWEWVQTFLALAAVIGLIFLVRYLLRRFGRPVRGGGGGGLIEVLARTSISTRQQLLLVRMGGRLVLVGAGPSGMTALSEVREPEEVREMLKALQTPRGGTFAELFRRKSRPVSGGDSPGAAAEPGDACSTGESRESRLPAGGGQAPGAAVREVAEKMRQRASSQEDKA